MIFTINFDKKKKGKKEKVVNTNYEREGRRTKDISVI